MTRDEKQDRPPRPAIELEALPPASPESGAARFQSDTQVDDWPIPENPPHNCPYCDYNLTGLTSRRCPECGEPFQVHEARWRGDELNRKGSFLQAALDAEKPLLIAGIVAGIIGIVLPYIFDISAWKATAALSTRFNGPPHFMVVATLPALVLVKYWREWRWATLYFIVGMALLLSGLFMVL